MGMTVQELIDELMKVKDKSKEVKIVQGYEDVTKIIEDTHEVNLM